MHRASFLRERYVIDPSSTRLGCGFSVVIFRQRHPRVRLRACTFNACNQSDEAADGG
jgi:hypothetical protein